MADLTPDEISFFATGELPTSMQAEVAAPVVVEQPAAPIAEPVTAPQVAVPDAAEMLRTSLAEEQMRRATVEAEMKILREQLEAKTKPVIPAPDPAMDPLGAMMHQLNNVNSTVQELQQKLAQTQQDNQLKTQFEQFTNSIKTIRDNFEKTTPDFNDAYQHVRNQRAADLRLTGVPEAQIPQVLLQDELNIAQNALKLGKNPAEEIYNMAKRYGYQGKAAAPADANARINSIIAGQAANKNPGAAAPPAADLSLESLKDMSNSDLTKVVMNDKQWEQLIGGKSHDIF